MTEENRRSLAKDVKKKGEDAKVVIRAARRDGMDDFKKQKKAAEISEDVEAQLEDELQKLTDDFMIIARIESLILERGMEDALTRAFAYVEAGADGIMIHSRKKTADEIIEFCDKFRAKYSDIPIVVVPTSYNYITEAELAAHGVNIVIYANQLTRSAFPAMENTAKEILKNHRALEVDSKLMPFKDIITLIDEL